MKKISYLFLSIFFVFLACSENDSSPAPSGNQGKGGSMARFAITGNYLYTVDNSNLNLFDISSPQHPKMEQSVSIGWGIETIHPFKNYLFMGSQTGMYIFNVANPQSPEFVSNYEHIYSCDPVVVDDHYAYITLRSGSSCRQGNNRLEIVDISDLRNPVLIKTYDMTQPYGLGVYDGNLFVCDDGLKIYDASDPLNLKLKDHFKINAYDVIPSSNKLSVIGSDGFYQYGYDGTEIKLLSKFDLLSQ